MEGIVQEIDRTKKIVLLEEEFFVPYDYLILAPELYPAPFPAFDEKGNQMKGTGTLNSSKSFDLLAQMGTGGNSCCENGTSQPLSKNILLSLFTSFLQAVSSMDLLLVKVLVLKNPRLFLMFTH